MAAKPIVKIVWSHASDAATCQIAHEITGQFQVMPRVVAAVKGTSEYSPEGRLARRHLKAWMSRVRELAKQTGNEGVIDSVEKVLLLLKGELPDYFRLN
jgi:hypothetical protein